MNISCLVILGLMMALVTDRKDITSIIIARFYRHHLNFHIRRIGLAVTNQDNSQLEAQHRQQIIHTLDPKLLCLQVQDSNSSHI
jgi:hypothetical protein